MDVHNELIGKAFDQALKSYREGGLPIGAVMAEGETEIAAGHNRRIQHGDLWDEDIAGCTTV